ncbi:preprotein translocase subunit SecA [Natronospira bacteriovora]|uniref:Protein translocase subunit SecA n=1 Tax=Natronospira bacteriovora TaxID=3069753 RepID=A0ABU0W6A6_9GAMM|nr:preprotein translocase subunit SecA [Natronospira sp. AB-CW4]MDQ2069497.1 preprotein translocase subunit SecA [Natronospira sp. AB-CW4]
MLGKLVKSIIGSRNERLLKKLRRNVDRINELESQFEALDDDALKGKTAEFRQRHRDGESLDDLLPEAFAAVREASRRTLGMRHFDVQLLGGMVLHLGKISEMKTGEGKTLVATLPAYLNAIPETGVHVVTVNDYLAERDAKWMEPIFNALDMTVGIILSGGQPTEEKRAAYGADITYGTNNEYGFDYLRDNMAFRAEDRVQGNLGFAIVDEVDSILIDEARTPLIISGPVDDSTDLYIKMDKLVPRLKKEEDETDPGDYTVDEKARQVHLTEQGHERVEEELVRMGLLSEEQSLYDAANMNLVHHLNAALRAHALFEKDVHYLVQDDRVIIVDEFTGRTMPGRRWSDGLHQAVEAKEGVKIQAENQTLASITFQNYFRQYEKLSGMTGTADTEAVEFEQIYGLEVVQIPTHKPMVRKDLSDLVYLSKNEKYDAIIEDIKDCHERGQPALVGTTSIEVSEYLSGLLKKSGIKHNVLNAKMHAKEAEVVADAGLPGAVTIATNMAGRGTDIVLGGNPDKALEEAKSDAEKEKIRRQWEERHQQVLDAGGLHIIGTERHESRRIDNQLRGRSGRQGDPGSSRFYLSLEDSLMRIFAKDRVKGILQKLGMQKGEAIEHPWVTRTIENAQRKVEQHNFDIRKNLLEYDNVANDQRKVIYEQRNELMATDDVSDAVEGIREDVISQTVDTYVPPESIDEMWDIQGLEEALDREFNLKLPIQQWLDEDDQLDEAGMRRRILEAADKAYAEKENLVGTSVLRHFEKAVMLRVLDNHWKEHLAAMDHLRQGINLRGFAQRNPKHEYKKEAFAMFADMLERYKAEVISILSKVQVRDREDVQAVEEQRRQDSSRMKFQHAQAGGLGSAAAAGGGAGGVAAAAGGQPGKPQQVVRDQPKVGRNEACPCGSGKKYKHCCGKLA